VCSRLSFDYFYRLLPLTSFQGIGGGCEGPCPDWFLNIYCEYMGAKVAGAISFRGGERDTTAQSLEVSYLDRTGR